ncbi:MAG: CocE/NonD family hydrolase C-terminal non-catalytic domain-containing protein, partial [Pseudomonadota bacterium]
PADCGAEAGEYCAIWLGPEMPGDQRGDDARSTTFTTAPQEAALDIVGAPTVTLMLATDQPQAQIAVRLNHVHPDGASTRITYGVLNLSHRKDAGAPTPMTPGVAEEVTLALDHIAYRVPAGHRLRVSISNAYWPLLWPSPTSTRLHLTQGHIDLPLRQSGDADEVSFAPPAAAAPWNVEDLRAESHVRRRETDLVSGAVTLVIEDDFGKQRDLDHGLISGTVARERWTIHPDDPLCASGACHWTDERQRGDIALRTETQCSMHADAETFYLSARLEAFENDVCIYARDVSESIPRDQM